MHQETVKVRATLKPTTRGGVTRVVRSKVSVSIPDSVEEAIKAFGGDDVLEMIGRAIRTAERLKAYEELVAQELGATPERVEEDVELKSRAKRVGRHLRTASTPS